MNIPAFVSESNRIEGILRDPYPDELLATATFIVDEKLSLERLIGLVSVYQPNARLRDRYGLNVMVGNHVPPKGAPEIRDKLLALLNEINAGTLSPYAAHVGYETLHPFTDGNGRSGRAIWAWQMVRAGSDLPIGFLHQFYYQALEGARQR